MRRSKQRDSDCPGPGICPTSQCCDDSQHSDEGGLTCEAVDLDDRFWFGEAMLSIRGSEREQFESRRVTVISGPADRDWGMRTLTFVDPGGYSWEIAQELPGPVSRNVTRGSGALSPLAAC